MHIYIYIYIYIYEYEYIRGRETRIEEGEEEGIAADSIGLRRAGRVGREGMKSWRRRECEGSRECARGRGTKSKNDREFYRARERRVYVLHSAFYYLPHASSALSSLSLSLSLSLFLVRIP